MQKLPLETENRKTKFIKNQTGDNELIDTHKYTNRHATICTQSMRTYDICSRYHLRTQSLEDITHGCVVCVVSCSVWTYTYRVILMILMMVVMMTIRVCDSDKPNRHDSNDQTLVGAHFGNTISFLLSFFLSTYSDNFITNGTCESIFMDHIGIGQLNKKYHSKQTHTQEKNLYITCLLRLGKQNTHTQTYSRKSQDLCYHLIIRTKITR